MKLGMFGLGKMGKLYVRDFKSCGANLVGAVCSTYESGKIKVSNLNSKYDLNMIAFSDEHALFQKDIDTIAICSSLETHLRFLEIGISQKKNIICEKPFFWDKKFSKKELKDKTHSLLQNNEKKFTVNLSNIYLAEKYLEIVKQKKLKFGKNFIFNFFTTVKNIKEDVMIDILPHFFSIFDSLHSYEKINKINKKILRDSCYITFYADDVKCQLTLKQGEKKSFLEFGFDNCILQRTQSHKSEKIKTHLQNEKIGISEEVNNPLTDFLRNFYFSVEENSELKINESFFVKNFFKLIDIVYE